MDFRTVSFSEVQVRTAATPTKKLSAVLSPKRQRIISGLEKEIIEFLIRLEVFLLILRYVPNPLRCRAVFQALDPHRKRVLGDRRIQKVVRVEGRYFWGLFLPAWPSRVFRQFIRTEISHVVPIPDKTNRFNNIFLAVTNKCPLACEHCYEWDALNQGERLTLSDLKSIVDSFQRKGVSQIHLSGGEPMARFKDVVELVQSARRSSEFWILTSGFGLTQERARVLKQSGLTGVMISLDHHTPDAHNHFRGHANAFNAVHEAVSHSIDAGLVTALSVCVTQSFVTDLHLTRYMELAKSMGVSFVQFLEPRATGHYKHQEVRLTPEQVALLEAVYLKYNYDPTYRDFPPICYHGYHQRRAGCLAAGRRSLYVDTVGDIHACPFCQRKAGNVLADDLDDAVEHLQRMGCHQF